MRAGIVSSSMIAREGRLDPAHYLGREDETAREIAKAEANVERADRRLVKAREVREAEVLRMQELVKSGDVKPLA